MQSDLTEATDQGTANAPGGRPSFYSFSGRIVYRWLVAFVLAEVMTLGWGKGCLLRIDGSRGRPDCPGVSRMEPRKPIPERRNTRERERVPESVRRLNFSRAVLSRDCSALYFDAMGMVAIHASDGNVLWRGGVHNGSLALPEQGCLVASGEKYSTEAFGVDSETGKVRWGLRTPEYLSAPAAGKGSLAVVDSQHETLALDARNGKILWRFERGGGPGFPPVIGPDGTVYLNGRQGTPGGAAPLWAFDPGSGKLRWEAETDGGANTPRVAPDGTIVTATLFTKHPAIYILDPSSGAIRSRIPLAADSSSTDVGPDGTIYVSQQTDRYGQDLIAVDPRTGKIKWRVGQEGLNFERCSFGLPGKVYAFAYRTEGQGGDRRRVESVLFALDERTGKTLWSFVYNSGDNPRLFFPLVGPDGTVFVGFWGREQSRAEYALDGETGKVKWKKDL